MSRAEKRRQQKLAKKAAKGATNQRVPDPAVSGREPATQPDIALALHHHTAGRLDEAESIYHQLLQADSNQFDAVHLLGVIAYQKAQYDVAVEFITKAITINPDYAEAHYNLGNAVKDQGKLSEAVAIYRKAIAIKPDYAEAHNNLGNALKDQGNLAEATVSYEKAIALKPGYMEAHNNLGATLLGLGKLDEAVASYREAIAIKPDYAEAHNNLGNVFKDQGKLVEAVASYQGAITIRPGYIEAYNNLGATLLDLGEEGEAAAVYHKAIAIKPDYVNAHYNLASIFKGQGKLDEAVASYQKAVTLNPDFAEAYINLGNAFRGQGKLDEAAASYRKAIDIKPDYGNAHSNLGVTLRDLGEFDAAVASYHRALAIDPDHAKAHANLGIALLDLGKLDEAMASYQKAIAIKPDFIDARSKLIFAQNYLAHQTPMELLAEARRYGAIVAAGAAPVSRHLNPPDPDRRLRVGFVSGDFCYHAVSFFLDRVFAEIDPKKLELFAYSTFTHEDHMTARLKKNVPQWRNVVWMKDDALAAKIIDDGIDILIDLSGHTDHHRLAVFARKPAPVQVAWLGYFATTGIDAIDYILCDKWVLPPDADGHFVEKPWRLPDSYLCFTPPDVQNEVAALPALARSHITFGCFNSLSKMTGPVVACWVEILRGVPDSRLFLKATQLGKDSVQKDVLSRFSACGIAPERLTLEGPSDRATYLAAYDRVDITLDPFPYGGVTTSVEGLWMGAPILTLQGDRFISRAGESILNNLGLGDWVADTPRNYVAKAIAFASDVPALATLRGGLRTRLHDSPVCNAPLFARNLEEAFQGMWRIWYEREMSGKRP